MYSSLLSCERSKASAGRPNSCFQRVVEMNCSSGSIEVGRRFAAEADVLANGVGER